MLASHWTWHLSGHLRGHLWECQSNCSEKYIYIEKQQKTECTKVKCQDNAEKCFPAKIDDHCRSPYTHTHNVYSVMKKENNRRKNRPQRSIVLILNTAIHLNSWWLNLTLMWLCLSDRSWVRERTGVYITWWLIPNLMNANITLITFSLFTWVLMLYFW